jgi:hypothetical protein
MMKMNKYTEMLSIERLAAAEALLKKISASGEYAKIFTVEEFVGLLIAVTDAKDLLKEDLLGRVEN